MSDDLGPRLRAAREAQRMSLRSLASAIGVSPSLLSQVETGKTKPSVSTLYALVSELGISTDKLLGRESLTQNSSLSSSPLTSVATPPNNVHEFLHISKDSHSVLEMENGVRWEKLALLDTVDVEALRVTYQPGGSSSVEGHLMRHLGIEHFYMLSGELTLHLEFEKHIVRAGDSAAFDSRRPHLFVNNADVPAIGIWYITGRKAELENSSAPNDERLHLETDGRLNSAVDVLRAFRD